MDLKRLGDYVDQVRGISYSPEEVSKESLTDYVPVLRAGNIGEDGLVLDDLTYIHRDRVRPEQWIRKGDVVIASSSGSKEVVGKGLSFEADYEGSFGAFCKVIRPRNYLEPTYLKHFFKTPQYRAHIKHVVQGANINNLKNEHINDQKLLIPVPDEQRRIAALLRRAEGLITQRKESIRLLDELVRSVFLEMFGDPVKNEKGWPQMRVDSIAEARLGKMLDKKKWTGTALRKYLRNTNVQWKRFNLTEVHEMDFSEKERKEFRLLDGDILMCEGGEVGRCAIWRGTMEECYFQKAVHRLRLDRTKVMPEFFVQLFWELVQRNGLSKHTTSSTIAHLTGEKLASVMIPIPPVAIQCRFEELVVSQNVLRKSYAENLVVFEHLYSSLSQRAFRGELKNSIAPDHKASSLKTSASGINA